MKTTILILWLSFFNTDTATNDGSIQTVEFDNVIACEIALNKIKKKSGNIYGICVFK